MLEISRTWRTLIENRQVHTVFSVVFSWCQTCMYSRLVILCLLMIIMYPWPFPRCQGAYFPPQSTFIQYRDQPALANVTLERQSIFTQSSSVQDDICALEKAHMRSTSSLSFPNVALQTVPMFIRLTMALSCLSRRSSSASFFHASLLQAIYGVVSLALCPQIVFQAPQYFKFSETQATFEGCFACQSICGVVSLTPACPGQYTHRSFRSWCRPLVDTFRSGLPNPFFTFCSKLIESVRMVACMVRLSPLEAIQRMRGQRRFSVRKWCMRMCVCVWMEWTWSLWYIGIYPHTTYCISSLLTMPLLPVLTAIVLMA